MKQEPELTERILELYPVWQSVKKVSALVHLSPTCVYLTLKRHGVKMRKPGGWAHNENRLPHDEVQATVLLYEHGYSTNEVGEMLGISHSTVRFRLHKAGVPLRTRSESARRRWERRGRITSART